MASIKKYFLFQILFCCCQQCLLSQSLLQKRIDSLTDVLKTAKEDTAKALTLSLICYDLGIAGELKKAREAGEASIKLSDKLDFIKGKASALNNIATLDWESGNLQEALDKYKVCAKINEEIGNKLELGHNLNNIGNIYWSKADYSEAINNYKNALKAYTEADSKTWIANTYNNLGSTFEQMGNYPEALRYLFTGLNLAKEAGVKDQMPIFYLNIGDIYLTMMNYPEALKNYQSYIAISQELGDKTKIAGAYCAIGKVYEIQGNYKDAIANYSLGLKLFIELDNKSLIAKVYNQTGSIYLRQSNYSEALKKFYAAAEILHRIGIYEPLTISYINIGDIISRQATLEKGSGARNKKYNEAIQILNKGLSLAKDIGAKESLKKGYKILSDVYKDLNDHKRALEFYDLYVAIKDSLLNNEVTRKLELQRTQYEVDNAVAEEKTKQEAVIAQQNAEHKRKNELLFTGLGILAIITAFSVMLFRQQNQKRRAVDKAESGHKMAELELQSLRAQLNPHFMFNSLNAIQDLILKEDNDRSQLYLSRFSKLLRILLENADQPFVSVKQEMEFLALYLSLENLRIPDLRFSIETDPKMNIKERMIPNMMLQPYIENAIWHGLSHKKENRELQVRIHDEGDVTVFEIEDNGVGRQKAAEFKSLYRKGHISKGMELLTKRFNLLSKEYGETIQTTVTDLEDNEEATGTLVKICVPFSLSEQAKQLMHDTNHHN